MKKNKLLILILSIALALMLCLSACGNSSSGDNKESDENNQTKDMPDINISVLNGSTGFGIAKLMSDSKTDVTKSHYKFTVESDASNITAALINKSIDIAALPTNAAANLYQKTNGEIKILAVNTKGVLYLVCNSEKVAIDNISELKGKTVYCPAQNPTFIFKYLCEKNGLEVGKDVIIDNSYAQPAELRTAIASGLVDIAVIPEPMVTIAKSANKTLTVSLDLTEEWKKVSETDSLLQGCIVVRTEFAEAHPDEIKKFLADYKESVDFTVKNPEQAAVSIAENKIFENKAVASKAIPNCNICYIDGEEMQKSLDEFFSALYSVAPASIGGKLPDSGIYYTSK